MLEINSLSVSAVMDSKTSKSVARRAMCFWHTYLKCWAVMFYKPITLIAFFSA